MHSLPPLGFTLGFLTLVGELQLDQMSFDQLPSLPRNPLLELCQESSPGCQSELCSASIFGNQQGVFYTAPLQKVMYKQARMSKQTHRSTHGSQVLVGLVPIDNPKFRYLQGSWFLVVQVLHLTGAGQSGLSCEMLSAEGTGVGEVLFLTLSSHSSALPCPMLELMGNK